MSISRTCFVLVPALFLLTAGLLYTGRAFRIRDQSSASTDVCHTVTGRCTSTFPSISSSPSWSTSSSLRSRRGFETVRTRGSFAKTEQPSAEVHDDSYHEPSFRKKNKKYNDDLSSKISKVETSIEENVSDDEEEEEEEEDCPDDVEIDNSGGTDSDDEIVQIEVEDEDEVIVDDSVESKLLYERLKREEEKEKLEEAVNEKKKLAEETIKEQEKLKLEELERERKETAERKQKEEEEDRKRKKRELEERRKKVLLDRKLQKEAERCIMEENERKIREENERKLKEQEELRIKEEEELRLKEEESRRLKEEEELKAKEEERLKEEQKRKNEEYERKQYEKEQLEAERKRKEDEEQKRKELEEEEAERQKKEKEEEEERKLREREEKEAERKRNENENRRRIENIKKQAELKKIRDEEEKRKKAKRTEDEDDTEDDDDDDDDDNGTDQDDDDDNGTEKLKVKLERVRLADKIKAKDSQAAKTVSKSATNVGNEAAETEDSKESSSSEKTTSKETVVNAPKATVSRPNSEEREHLTLAELNDIILSVPTFVPNFTAVEDLVCQQHGRIFLQQLRGYKLWAMQMLDSSAKIPAGLLRGNVNQLGDFDQCLGVMAQVKLEEATIRVQGKYCLASVDLYAAHQGAKLPVNLMQSRTLIRSSMRDPGHFVPRFTTVNWALCLPAACSAADARRSIEHALDVYNRTTGIKFAVGLDPGMCYVKERSTNFSKETVAVLYFYAFVMGLAIVATLRDCLTTSEAKAANYTERIIMAFSFKRTVKALLEHKEVSPFDIGCIHGIRSLSTIALYVAHKLIPMALIPYANRVSLTEIAGTPLSTLLRGSLFYTDSFLLLSGVLTAYHMAKELSVRGEIRWICRYVARAVRLTPALLAVVFWYAFVSEHTGSGPHWNAVVKTNADICKQNGWLTLLYVQNFIPFEEMCAPHTHQLALDMQLTLLAPVVVFFLQIKPVLGIVIVFFLLQASATLRYYATSTNNLSLFIFHGMTSRQLYKTANLTYVLSLHRATPYVIGVCLGVLLHYTGKNVRIHKIFVVMGWMIAAATGSWSLFSPWRLARRDYVYDVEDAAHYAVISPIFTALFLSWTIFACFTDNGGIINNFLSSHWLVVFSKLSYSIYLSQFAVFFYNVGSARYSSEFQVYKIIDPFEICSVVICSIILTLLFDTPMQEVKSIIMECSESLYFNFDTIQRSLSNENQWKTKKLSRAMTLDNEEEEDPGGWNWDRGTFTKSLRSEPEDYDEDELDEPYRSSRSKRLDNRRQTIIRSEAYDEWDNRRSSRRNSRSEEHLMSEGRTSRSDYRSSNNRLDEDLMNDDYRHPRERYFSSGYTRSPIRDLDVPIIRRSASRERPISQDREIYSSDYSNKPVITISKEEDYKRYPRSSYPRFSEQQRSLSTESDIDVVGIRRNSNNFGRHASAEPRLADDSEWEEELRNRRSRYLHHRVSSQERERVPSAVVEEKMNGSVDEWNPLRRRSSAEGKMALLEEPIRPGNMELWTVSKLQLGSSQEPDDDDFEDEYLQERREYREQDPPFREDYLGDQEDERDEIDHCRNYASESLPTSLEEEDDVTNFDFVLSKDSKRITVQDLSNLPSDEEISSEGNWNRLDVKSGLFKRESIIKSQASEEDPEYLLPERPKLVEQEQEHPFKKAWQMQKSRSEEDGSSSYAVKDSKMDPSEKQKEESELKNKEEDSQKGGQSAEIPSPDVACEVTLVWQPRSSETEDTKSTSKSESSSSAGFDWQDEQQLENRDRRKSEEENWSWTERDT